MEYSFRRKTTIVLGACAALGAIEAILLLILGKDGRIKLYGNPLNPLNPYYSAARAFVFRPAVLLGGAVVLAAALYWALQPTTDLKRERIKLIVLALALCSLFGFLLSWLYKV